MSDPYLHICVVCTGNICRSPMGQNILREHLAVAGLDSLVRVSSAGIGPWHVGHPADERAQRELLAAGYSAEHTAAQFGQDHRRADLYLAMDHQHLRDLDKLGVGDRTRLLRSFDPEASGDEVVDPYYGSDAEFTRVREQIEAAVPGVLAWVRERLADSA